MNNWYICPICFGVFATYDSKAWFDDHERNCKHGRLPVRRHFGLGHKVMGSILIIRLIPCVRITYE